MIGEVAVYMGLTILFYCLIFETDCPYRRALFIIMFVLFIALTAIGCHQIEKFINSKSNEN